jgi:uncharacterized protein (DUF2252 family)
MGTLTAPAPEQVDREHRPHPTRAELLASGKRLRESCPRQSHAGWTPPPDRPDPLDLLQQSSEGRIPELIPVRYGRMMESPFAWYRGTALIMASDLSHTPASGLRVQACGDAHLANFGAYGTPERRTVFDLNDFDETLPAPWEWDVKRLGASFVLACRSNGFRDDPARDAVLACVRSYREHMADLSEMRALEVWYADHDLDSLLTSVSDKETLKRGQKRLTKARKRSLSPRAFPEWETGAEGLPSIKDNPPLIYHWKEHDEDELMAVARQAFAHYRSTLPEHLTVLLDRFELMDMAIKVVGVGSVGTRCFIQLLMGGENDALFLQVKEARPSVLEPYAGSGVHSNNGQRIVAGCRLMQAASDLFLGWTQSGHGRDYYVRQLRDMKIKPLIEAFTPSFMLQYAAMCGRSLANAHARSGSPAGITGYLGKSDRFDEAIADFATAYADQSERDHAALVKAVRTGQLEATQP